MKKKRIIGSILLALLVIGVITCFIYVRDYYHADDSAAVAMQSESNITVSMLNRHVQVYAPDQPKAGLIFYPGGKVECSAYAPLMKEYARNGFLCLLVQMPGNLAVLDGNAAEGLCDQFPEIEDWYIGGHSLGGVMAANYAAEHTEELDGLILLAAYSTKDLNETGLQVLSIYGSEDGVLNMDAYREHRNQLPENAVEHVIDGGCHAFFGSYGAQDGDGIPRITVEEQITETVRFTTENIPLKPTA